LKTITAVLALILALGGSPAHPQAAAVEPLSAFAHGVLAIRTQGGNVHHFSIWIADRQDRQEQGLMFVRTLEDHRGMLFVYARDQHIAMWMKNTYLPLDMLFIRADGTIAHIAARTTPESLDIIEAPGKLRAVLELAGGTAGRLGIQVGDRVFSDALPDPGHAGVVKPLP
jgi:uncharacterized membrane protein (UPF0127 family)